MNKCLAKDLLYNSKTKRCYKPCEQKNKVTHPRTQKCRQKCKSEKIRRIEDFRCVKKTHKLRTKYVKKERIEKEKAAPLKAPLPVVEPLIPPPLEKSLTKNFQFLDDLLTKGKSQSVDYQPFAQTSGIITIYFHEKYKQACPMYPIKYYDEFEDEYKFRKKEFKSINISKERIKQEWLKTYKNLYMAWDEEKFLKNLKLCLETGEKLIMVPIYHPGHLNMVIIKEPTREIICFEPHGDTYKGAEYMKNIHLNKFLKKLTNTINTYLKLNPNNMFTYVPPSQLCPRYNYLNIPPTFYDGFQVVGERNIPAGDTSGGFCQLWSWFFAECVINNPEMDVKEVYKKAYDILKTDESQFATIIRGYFLDINDELVKMNRALSLKKEYLANRPFDDFLLDYLNQSRANLRNKPRKPFVGGLKNKKFILPPINPNVEPVIL